MKINKEHDTSNAFLYSNFNTKHSTQNKESLYIKVFYFKLYCLKAFSGGVKDRVENIKQNKSYFG